MRTEHLSDEELQTLVLGQQIPDTELMQHTEGCSSCQEQMAVYKLLLIGIQEQILPSFDFDLANAVLQQLPPAKIKKRTGNIRPFVIAAFVTVPLYLFRNNFLHLATAISAVFLLICVLACASIMVNKVLKMYDKYRKQLEKLNFSE